MHLKLTIFGNAAQLASVLSLLGAGDPGAIAATPIVNQDDDDDGLHPAFNAVPAPAALAETLLQNHAAQVATPAAPVAAPVVDNTRDSEGLPWDKRIHASSKVLNSDGTWRKKRNLDETILNAVLNELRTANPATTPAVAPAVAPAAPVVPPMPVVNADGEQMPAPAAPVVPPMPVVAAPVVAPAAPVVAAAPEPVVPAAPATVPDAIDMPTFMMHIAPKMGSILTPEYLAAVTGEISGAFQQPLTVITDIAPNPAMIKYAADILARDGKW